MQQKITPFESNPENSIALDIRRLADVTAGSVDEVFIDFTCPKGFEAVITHYALFCDARLAEDVEFIPRLQNKRVFPYHGTPDPLNPNKIPYKMSLGVSSDLADYALLEANLLINEGFRFTWSLTNRNDLDQTMGVRMKGYLRPVNEQRSVRFAG